MPETTTCSHCKEPILTGAKRCKHCNADLRNWFNRHPVITILVAFLVIPPIMANILSSKNGGNDISSGEGVSNRPSINNIEIIDWSLEQRTTSVYIVGEIRNNNTQAVGVQLQAVLRDKDGNVVDSTDWWPASTRNIPAGTSQPIKFPVSRQGNVENASLQVIAVKVW